MLDTAVVTVIDDDESVRESLPDLLRSFGFSVHAFASGEAFFASGVIERTNCLVLDVAMPGMSGPDVKQELERRQHAIPVIFITAQSSGVTCERLLSQGAAACLHKPFTPATLVSAVNAALPQL